MQSLTASSDCIASLLVMITCSACSSDVQAELSCRVYSPQAVEQCAHEMSELATDNLGMMGHRWLEPATADTSVAHALAS